MLQKNTVLLGIEHKLAADVPRAVVYRLVVGEPLRLPLNLIFQNEIRGGVYHLPIKQKVKFSDDLIFRFQRNPNDVFGSGARQSQVIGVLIEPVNQVEQPLAQ